VRETVRCAIYTRQSVGSDGDLSSCQVQFETCRAYIQSLRSKNFELVAERFDDDGYSGTTLDRPALKRLLEVVRSGGVERVVIHRLDRLSRNLRHFVTLFEELRDRGVKLDIVAAPELGVAALDNLMLSILASFAEFERDMAATRIAEARAHLKSKGRRVAGAVPFGYSADPHTKQLVVCEKDADIVVRMFKWAQDGVAPANIAALANALGWETGARQPWTARQVLSILSNHVYAGLVVQGFGFREGCHPALIGRELFHSVQRKVCGRRTRLPGRRAPDAGIVWILRGLLTCGRCGRPMSTHTAIEGSKVRCYYRCRSTAGGREPCKGVMVSTHDAENAVLRAIGADRQLTSQEQRDAIRRAVRSVVYDAETGDLTIGVIKPPDGLADDGAVEAGRPEAPETHTSGPRHR
jgi:site-specific DNA recombinase